ncbi:hypothetical protein A9Q84_21505 [Halobacteriovorax marinus]|uniref:Uncharacterized protein n=1 Tax=Halobacteriovorax marinus TaxID=97084 RepID=A0A1Y5F872_9BACT|nr:hypothetical protein A9Q84_21505 [Halobacteriovorax marinus]
MQKVIVISGCQKSRVNRFCCEYDFHFIGYLCGKKVTKIKITSRSDQKIMKGDEYLLFLEVLSLKRGVLLASLIKFKNLKNICYLNK